MARPSAIVFDLDDTLYPERDYVLSGFRAVSAFVADTLATDAERCYEELVSLFDSGARPDVFDRWVSDREPGQAALVRSMVRTYRTHDPMIQLEPSTSGLLGGLRQKFLLGLITDGRPQAQRAKLKALGIEEGFDALVITGELGQGYGKPNPRAYLTALGTLGVEPASAVFVADNPVKDFIGARQVGMKSIRLRRPEGIYAHLEPQSPALAPDTEIERLSELPIALAVIEAIEAANDPQGVKEHR